MPNVSTVNFRAPYRARITRAGATREHDVEDVFPVAVKVADRADVVPVVTLVREEPDKNDEPSVLFVEIDGRLFRPFSVKETGGTWTPGLCAKRPPLLGLAQTRPLGRKWETRLGVSPFHAVDMESPDNLRRRARGADPERVAGAHRRLQALADRMRIVDGTLFQETRPPGWVYGLGWREMFFGGVPDASPEIPYIVLDARHPKRDIERFLRRFDRGAWVDCEFEIHDPSRIPDTAKEDSIVGFALEMSRNVCARPLGDQHPDFVRLTMALHDAVQKAVDERQPFDDAYAIVRRMAGPAGGELPSDDDSRDAALFVRMLDGFPPPTMRHAPQPVDEADAEALGGAFLP